MLRPCHQSVKSLSKRHQFYVNPPLFGLFLIVNASCILSSSPPSPSPHERFILLRGSDRGYFLHSFPMDMSHPHGSHGNHGNRGAPGSHGPAAYEELSQYFDGRIFIKLLVRRNFGIISELVDSVVVKVPY